MLNATVLVVLKLLSLANVGPTDLVLYGSRVLTDRSAIFCVVRPYPKMVTLAWSCGPGVVGRAAQLNSARLGSAQLSSAQLSSAQLAGNKIQGQYPCATSGTGSLII